MNSFSTAFAVAPTQLGQTIYSNIQVGYELQEIERVKGGSIPVQASPHRLKKKYVRTVTPVCWIVESGCKSDPNQGGLTDGCSVIYDCLLVRLFTFIQCFVT